MQLPCCQGKQGELSENCLQNLMAESVQQVGLHGRKEHALPLHQVFSAPYDAIFMKFWELMDKVRVQMPVKFHKDHSMYARTASKTASKIARG